MSNSVTLSAAEIRTALERLAMNLRWTWAAEQRDIFRDVNAGVYKASGGNPVAVLRSLDDARVGELAHDARFVRQLGVAVGRFDCHMHEIGRFWTENGDLGEGDVEIAYFCMEYALDALVRIYSGGLGVLAGDHLKSASDLDVPLVAVGLLYRESFRQVLRFGWQHEEREPVRPADVGIRPLNLWVDVDLDGRRLRARLWAANVGKTWLLLLDADIDENSADLREVTARLYEGGDERRLQQEILLGVGGVRALEATGHRPDVFHMNEGHAGFLALERLRVLQDRGLSRDQARELVRRSTIFTTHTPVPAGIDRFDRGMAGRYLWRYAEAARMSFDELAGLAAFDNDGMFNMAMLGLNMAGRANGVSELHGAVSRGMFGLDRIGHVTNGVHGPTWAAPEWIALFEKYVGPDWHMADEAAWRGIWNATDEELWALRNLGARRLVEMVRGHLGPAFRRAGWTADLEWTEHVLDPSLLTIGLARRAAEYKRMTLLTDDMDRLRRLLLDATRPVQIIYAGKSHPDDGCGKKLVQIVSEIALQTGIRHRLIFLQDYNMRVAAAMVRGVDVWFNTPEYGKEASGTSGEKAVYAGKPNLSRPDGWWWEMSRHGVNGWDIGPRHRVPRGDVASAAFRLLEHEVRDAFYGGRGEDGIPRRWTALMRDTLATLGWRVSSSRMVMDYVRQLYVPAYRDAVAYRAEIGFTGTRG